MSAWMISAAHADFLASAYVDRVQRDFDPRPIGQALMDECALSIKARYPDDDHAAEAAKDYSFNEWPGITTADPAMIAYELACYEYQSCEHDGWEASAVKAMCDELKATISAEDMTRSDSAPFGTWPWGIDEEHRPINDQQASEQAKPEPAQAAPLTDEQRKEAREALRALAVGAPDDEFDEFGQAVALGLQIGDMFKGIDLATELAAKLGARSAHAMAAISHKGHEYHVRAERCPNCEQKAEAEAEPEPVVEAAPDAGTNDALAPAKGGE